MEKPNYSNSNSEYRPSNGVDQFKQSWRMLYLDYEPKLVIASGIKENENHTTRVSSSLVNNFKSL